MEILTILRANIRHKKGSFVSILLLMAIISMALISIVSVQDNIYGGIADAQERAKVGNVICMIDKNVLSQPLISDVKKHPLVKSVKMVEAIDSQINYGKYDYGNTVYIREISDGYRLFDHRGTGYSDEIPKLEQGEIYIPQGLKTIFDCEEGETLTLTAASGSYDFKIAGIIEEPEMGASMIGWKNVFIGHKDYEKIYSEVDRLANPEEGFCTIVKQFSVYKKEDCSLTDAKFARQLNLDTGIADMSFGVMTRELMLKYTFLFTKIICMTLFVFVILLLAAVVVIMCHSVSTGIEMEYTTFGIMKSQGFVKAKMQLILVLQYLLAQVIGIVFGTIAAIPLCGVISDVFIPITAIVPRRAVSLGTCGAVLLCVIAISVACIVLITGRIARISPVRAIAGGTKEIYFDSRFKAAISKKMLSASLALRQFTSNKRQYAGVIAIVALLVYFMTTMMVLANVITATSAWEDMGIPYSDLDIELKEALPESEIEKIEETIGRKSSFEVSYKDCGNFYFSINGEQIMACVFDEPEYLKGMSKGRIPLYDNEIAITQVAADNLDLKLGDKVVVRYKDKKEEYIISGINQSTYDAGVNFSITRAAAAKLCHTELFYMGYILEDKAQGHAIADELNEKYGDSVIAVFDESPMDETYELAIHAMTLVVYIFSVIFSVVVVHMVCSKAFVRERRDIGIYKAVGFTTARLRLQFAVRFSIVAVIGAVIGSGLAAVFAGNMLSSILRFMGISSFKVTFHFLTFAVPITLICICFFLFAFAASRKIKSVEVRELVVE